MWGRPEAPKMFPEEHKKNMKKKQRQKKEEKNCGSLILNSNLLLKISLWELCLDFNICIMIVCHSDGD